MTTTLTHTTPRCPHFGQCGGCQLQNIAYEDQLDHKRGKLAQILTAANIAAPAITSHASEPYEYRNRIRLRLERIEGAFRLGYNRADSTDFLPITTCSIAAPILWQSAEALLSIATTNHDSEAWLNATAQVELFTSDTADRVQLTLLCNGPRKTPNPTTFPRFAEALTAAAPQITTTAAVTWDPRTALTGRTLASHGPTGLTYRVNDETYWITRGAFFQVNRFLLPTLVSLVTSNRSGQLAFDLFAGVGLFSRILARSFQQVTAVEANPIAATDLRNALTKLGAQHQTVQATTLDFLQRAILERDRPQLIVLDPPRFGAGPEACALILRLAPEQIVYVSCDPATLARDLASLHPQYSVSELHLLDHFPQTTHIETVAILRHA